MHKTVLRSKELTSELILVRPGRCITQAKQEACMLAGMRFIINDDKYTQVLKQNMLPSDYIFFRETLHMSAKQC